MIFFEPRMTFSLWLPLFSSSTGEILSSVGLSPPASWCLQKSEEKCMPVTELPEILYLHPLSVFSFFHPAGEWHPPRPLGHRISGTSHLVWNRYPPALRQNNSLHSYLNVYFTILPFVCLCRLAPSPSWGKKKSWVTADEPNCLVWGNLNPMCD